MCSKYSTEKLWETVLIVEIRKEYEEFIPSCIITRDTNKTNSTLALLRQGVMFACASFFSMSMYFWLCIVL